MTKSQPARRGQAFFDDQITQIWYMNTYSLYQVSISQPLMAISYGKHQRSCCLRLPVGRAMPRAARGVREPLKARQIVPMLGRICDSREQRLRRLQQHALPQCAGTRAPAFFVGRFVWAPARRHKAHLPLQNTGIASLLTKQAQVDAVDAIIRCAAPPCHRASTSSALPPPYVLLRCQRPCCAPTTTAPLARPAHSASTPQRRRS